MKHEPFYDERLAPQENKAVEMLLNGMTRSEICDEMDIDYKHLSVLFYNARTKGVHVPKAPAGSHNRGRVSIERINELYDDLERRGFKRAGLWEALSQRTGLSINCLRVRRWRFFKQREGQAA